jgi:hypothetical protein
MTRVPIPVGEWRIEEDDYGDAMIFHRHAASEEPAYIIGRGPDQWIAQCSTCLIYLELEPTGIGEPALRVRP